MGLMNRKAIAVELLKIRRLLDEKKLLTPRNQALILAREIVTIKKTSMAAEKVGRHCRCQMTKIYYAHPMKLYGTPWEQQELTQIRKRFPRRRIVNPASYEGHPEKLQDTVGFCLKLVEKCEVIVFRRFFGKVTAGVGKEVNHALRLGKPVYEISNGRFKPVSTRQSYISRERTNRLYDRFDWGDFPGHKF